MIFVVCFHPPQIDSERPSVLLCRLNDIISLLIVINRIQSFLDSSELIRRLSGQMPMFEFDWVRGKLEEKQSYVVCIVELGFNCAHSVYRDVRCMHSESFHGV